MMLPYTDPSYLLHTSCNLRNDEFPAHPPLLSPQAASSPNYFPLNPANFDPDSSFLNILCADHFTVYPPSQPQPDQVSIAKKATAVKLKNSTAGGSGKQWNIRRTERHSKIHTAQGLRGRRMRLSLEVAHKFFGLQDLLGFDKASATVDWLITQSRSAIEQHLAHFARTNSLDYSDDASLSACSGEKSSCISKRLSQTLVEEVQPSVASRKVSLRQLLTRESRTVARARARERTKEKKKKMQVELNNSEARQFDHFRSQLYNRIEKDEWPIGEVPDCPLDNQARTLVKRRMDYDYFRRAMAGELSQPNEASKNFFHEQLAGNFSGDVENQQTPLLAEVQFDPVQPAI